MATSPRIMRNSSIWVTLRLLVHPVDGHATTLVSGMSLDSSGPEVPSSGSTPLLVPASRRHLGPAGLHQSLTQGRGGALELG